MNPLIIISPIIRFKTKPIGDSLSASFDVGFGLLDFLDLFNQRKLGPSPWQWSTLPDVSGPSLSGGVFDDEQHRFGPNDLLRAPQRTTKPLGWHINMGRLSKNVGRDQRQLVGWSHLQRLSRCAQMCGKHVFELASIDVGLMQTDASAHHPPIAWKCLSPQKSNLVADRQVSLGGLGGHGISWNIMAT